MEKGGGGRTIRGKKEAEQVQTDDTVRGSWTEERGCGKSQRNKMKNDVGNGKKQFTCSMKRLRSEQYSLFHPVCYILGCGSIVFIVVEELSFPRRQGKSRSRAFCQQRTQYQLGSYRTPLRLN